jgi:Zn-dependent protease with chaperone function
MYAFIIAGLLSAVVALDQWGEDAPPQVWVAVSQMAVVAILVGLAGTCISAYILWRRGDLAKDDQRFLRKVRILGRLYRLAVLVANGVVLKQIGWAALAYDMAGRGTWDAPAMAIAAAPFVALCGVAWTAVYWADRVLRVALYEQAGAIATAGEWTLPRYLEFMFRQYLLVMLMPLLAMLGIEDLLAHTGSFPGTGLLGLAAMLGSVLGVVVFAGLWVRICWRTEPLPDGDLRRRLCALSERAGVRVGNILVWRTNLTMTNAAMIGMVGPFRYIMITDALLLAMSQAPEETEAVFAHEIAHVKYRHTLLYGGLLLGAVGSAYLAGEAAAAMSEIFWAPDAAAGVVLLGYFGFIFGYVSRRCELEADLYAVRATECPAGCSPPSAGYAAGQTPPGAEEWAAAATPQSPVPFVTEGGTAGLSGRVSGTPPRPGEPAVPHVRGGEAPVTEVVPAAYGNGLCPHRIQAFIGALRRIARLNGMARTARGWRHFSIARRCEVLEGLAANPAGVVKYERRIRRLKRAALAASFALAIAAGAYDMAFPPSEPNNPEHPARPENVRPEQPTWIVRLVYRDKVDAVAFRPPEFHGDADAAAHLDDGRLAGLRRNAAAADDEVAVADARAHAVSVDAQGERARTERPDAGHLQVLDDAVGRGLR